MRLGSSAPSRRIRVIWNASAGSKAGISTNSATEEQMRELMARHGLGDELCRSESEADAVALASEAVEAGYDVVVAAGGDGTVGTIACQLLDTGVALGVLPLGSVMNIARMIGLPRDLEQAAEVVSAGSTRVIDVGETNGRPFFECGSVGMNAAIFREAQRVDDGSYGALLGAIRVALRYRPARVRIHLVDRTIRSLAMMVTVANGSYTWLGLYVATVDQLDDG